MGCGDITIGSKYDCDKPLVGGTRERIGVINKTDIASVTYSATVPNLVTAVTLKSGKVMHLFEGFKNSVLPSLEKLSAPSGQALWKHVVNFFIYENTQEQKNNIAKMGNGKFVTIYQNSDENNNAFEIQGIGTGLRLQDGAVNNKNENQGAYNLILASDAGQEEGRPPSTYLSTDFAGTLSAFESLAALPTITGVSPTSAAVLGGTAMTVTGTKYFGGGSSSDVQSVKWINRSTGGKTLQTGLTVTDTQITFASVALSAGTYNIEVTTSRGVVTSETVVTVA
jgi:hypothetical protein